MRLLGEPQGSNVSFSRDSPPCSMSLRAITEKLTNAAPGELSEIITAAALALEEFWRAEPSDCGQENRLVSQLLRLVRSDSCDCNSTALWALGKSRNRDALEAIVDYLRHSEAWTEAGLYQSLIALEDHI